jgi:hypothetical protein
MSGALQKEALFFPKYLENATNVADGLRGLTT